jgi:prophage maintenance system killer protein
MPRPRRLNLSEIESSLLAVQADFDQINSTLSTPRDPLSDRVIGYMMRGYEQVDRLLAEDHDLFRVGSSGCLLGLNHLVLCGAGAEQRADCRQQIQATAAHFYDHGDGGVEALINRVRILDGESVWRRAAGVYIQVLSQPQLFIEGNHRTGALIMSWMLAREGRPPFVLSVANAKAYFDPSELVKNARKRTLKMLVERPKLIRRFAELLESEADRNHSR